MDVLVNTLYAVILPIFLLIGLGVLLDRRMQLDLATLAQLNFYVFAPAIVFSKTVEARIEAADIAMVALFTVAHVMVLYGMVRLLFVRLAPSRHETVLSMSSLFYNCGNFGIPFVLLAFGPDAVGILAIVLMVQNFMNFTLGVWMMEKHGRTPLQVVAGLARIPVIHAVVWALVLRGLNLRPVAPIADPIRYLADGLIPVALVTLGIQLSRSRITQNVRAVATAVGIRLVASPLVAALLVLVFRIPNPVAPVLIVAAGFPVAVNVFILAAQYGRDEDVASQTIFWSTLLSAVTLTVSVALI